MRAVTWLSRLLRAPVSPWWCVASDMAIRQMAPECGDPDVRVAVDDLWYRLDDVLYAMGVRR